jgi:large subunit ribosomal protein L30
MSEATTGALRITLVRSTIGRPKDQEATVRSLGLRRLHQTVERPDNAAIRGMVTKIRHLVTVEPVATAAGVPAPAAPAASGGSRFVRYVDGERGEQG